MVSVSPSFIMAANTSMAYVARHQALFSLMYMEPELSKTMAMFFFSAPFFAADAAGVSTQPRISRKASRKHMPFFMRPLLSKL